MNDADAEFLFNVSVTGDWCKCGLPITLTFGSEVPDTMGMQWLPVEARSWPRGQHCSGG